MSLGGYRGVRAELLVALRKAQPVTAHELGAQFGLTPNALRRYLKVLEEEGLVRFSRIVRGLGAPVYAFSLTESGEALFPRTYASVLTSALTALRETGGTTAVRNVFAKEWESLAVDASPLLESLPLSERAALMAELLTSRGYMAETVTVDANGVEVGPHADVSDAGPVVTKLRLRNCSMREIAELFPEACEAEAEFVEQMLGVPMVREGHQLRGCRTCEYSTAFTGSCASGSSSTALDTEPVGDIPLKLADKKA